MKKYSDARDVCVWCIGNVETRSEGVLVNRCCHVECGGSEDIQQQQPVTRIQNTVNYSIRIIVIHDFL